MFQVIKRVHHIEHLSFLSTEFVRSIIFLNEGPAAFEYASSLRWYSRPSSFSALQRLKITKLEKIQKKISMELQSFHFSNDDHFIKEHNKFYKASFDAI